MSRATFRFYGQLNDFLPFVRKQVTFTHVFEGRASIKDMIESLGVPHPEIDLIIVNGEPVDFSYLVQPGDRIGVYPYFESLDISPILRVRPEPLLIARFVLDTHLGKLATYLRLLGFDTLYRNDYPDEALAHLSSTQQRILLTRDRGLLKRSIVTHGYCIRHIEPRQQVIEVLRRFKLFDQVKPLVRCTRCNGLLAPVDKEVILHHLNAETKKYYDEFSRCQDCGRVYWRGSHYQRIERFVAEIRRCGLGSAI